MLELTLSWGPSETQVVQGTIRVDVAFATCIACFLIRIFH